MRRTSQCAPVLLALSLLASVAPAHAQPVPDTRELLGEIEQFETQILALDARLTTLATSLASADSERLLRRSEAESAQARIEERKGSVGSLLRSLYRIQRFGVLRLLFDADDPIDLRRRANYLRTVLAIEAERTADFAALATEKAKATAAAEAADTETRRLQVELKTQRESLDAERKRRVALVREIRSQPALAGRVVVETTTARAAMDSSIRAREATMPAAPSFTSKVDFRSLRGKLPKPVAGHLLRAFGPSLDVATGARSSNAGMDWAAEPGTPFRCVASGEVTRAGYVRGYGQMVMVQHGSFSTLYAHANGIRAFVGQVVSAGDTLGTVGTTGLADDRDPQLHFEIRYNGTPQDPSEWLAR